MNVRFTPEADEQADTIDVWWREHRPSAPGLFARELADAWALVAANPKIGTVYTLLDGEPVRKVYMPRTRHHVYYTYNQDDGEIVIHAVWGAPKGRGPKL
jgi:plasmid stabilization system protein ParE